MEKVFDHFGYFVLHGTVVYKPMIRRYKGVSCNGSYVPSIPHSAVYSELFISGIEHWLHVVPEGLLAESSTCDLILWYRSRHWTLLLRASTKRLRYPVFFLQASYRDRLYCLSGHSWPRSSCPRAVALWTEWVWVGEGCVCSLVWHPQVLVLPELIRCECSNPPSSQPYG